jgi:Fic family protein
VQNFGIPPLTTLGPGRFETPGVLKPLAAASRQLAELKGLAAAIPEQDMLVSTLGMQEAKDSSAIENIVTTHDELFRDEALGELGGNPAAKEVLRYRSALRIGYEAIRKSGLITLNQILDMQAELEHNSAGFRTLPGTVLKDGTGKTVYTPPQDPAAIREAMGDLERFLNDDALHPADPLVKMALAHHQFESIHPFYDGNGRTGRILNVLYLVKQGLLDAPVLYLSRHIVRTKPDYYRLLQQTRERDTWEEWVAYMLEGVETTARETIGTIRAIRDAMEKTRAEIRERHKFYSQDLVNNLYAHPYTKVQFLERDLGVARLTAAKYLDALASGGTLRKQRIGRTNVYVNVALYGILTGKNPRAGDAAN